MSFTTSLSGLNANQQKLNVIGNNLANLNTVGFKASTVQFTDLVSQSVGGSSTNPAQIGLGVTTGSISANFSQGGIDNTGVPTNVAIQGNGFFVIGTTNRSYTRAGDFSFNQVGALVTSDGQKVQGYTAVNPATGAIVTTGQPTDIVVPPGVLRPPTATTSFATVLNLDASATVASTFTASAPIYDALGTAHVATITYTNTASGAWTYSITVPGADLAAGVVGVPSVIKAGTLTFTAAGALSTVDGAAAANVAIAGPVWRNGATPTALTWSVLDSTGAKTLTGYSAPSATSSVTQNGSGAAAISSINIDATGQILASLGAGQTVVVVVGIVALANFNNPQGLVKLGGNKFGEAASAGAANVGVAGTGGRGSLVGSALEGSNVDMAQEFTQMILAQRGYQANGKGITTADQLLVEALNLKQ